MRPACQPLAALIVLATAMLMATAPLQAQTQPAPDRPQETRPATSIQPPASLYNPGEVFRNMANPVVADIDGYAITLSDVGDAIRALPDVTRSMPFEQLYPAVLDRLVQQRALVMKARRERLDADPVVKRRMQDAADRVLESELLNRILDKSVTDDVLLARYRKDYDGKPGPEEVHVWAILVPTEDQARKLIAELAAGADFATLARRDSTDPTRQMGGDVGFRRQDQLAPEIGGAAFAMEPGKVAPYPVRVDRGWFVVKAEARRRVGPLSFPEMRPQVRQQVQLEEVARVAREVVAGADVHKFNINGSPLGVTGPEQGNRAQ